MQATQKKAGDGLVEAIKAEQWPGIDSSFRLIIVAAQRNKQLLRGALPRVEADPRRRRNTSIALEEVRRGLVPFTNNTKDRTRVVGGEGPDPDES